MGQYSPFPQRTLWPVLWCAARNASRPRRTRITCNTRTGKRRSAIDATAVGTRGGQRTSKSRSTSPFLASSEFSDSGEPALDAVPELSLSQGHWAYPTESTQGDRSREEDLPAEAFSPLASIYRSICPWNGITWPARTST